MRLEAITSKQKEILNNLKYFKEYYLAGGTALALQIGHRVSVDFDFFSKKDIPKNLLPKIKKIFKGFKIETVINHSEQLTVNVNDVNLTFVRYPFPLIHQKLKEYKGIKMLGIEEIAATKAFSIGKRATLKDYVDLYFILKEKRSALKNIIKLAEKKYKKEFDLRLFFEQLIFLSDIEDMNIRFLKKRVSKDGLQSFFEEKIKKFKIQ